MHYYKHILVPIDLTHDEVGEHMLKVAKSLVGETGQITLVTVFEHTPSFVYVTRPASTGQMDDTYRRAHDRLSEIARAAGVEPRIVLCEGNAAAQILEEANKCGCDVIIIGSHRPDYRDYFIGSTAARVVRHAQVSVMVERSGPLTVPPKS
jgi:universal stress protein F